MDDVTSMKVRSVAEEIRALARHHGVVYEATPLDELGNVITRLAGDDVELDETQLLLLAFVRAGVLTKENRQICAQGTFAQSTNDFRSVRRF
jgi:hypothetical protein